MSIGIIFGFLTMFGFGVSNAMSQKSAKILGSIKTTFFRGVFVSAILGIFAIFSFRSINLSLEYIVIASAISLLGYFPLIILLRALKTGKVGMVMPIANSSSVFTIILAVIFFKESLAVSQVASVVAIFIGIILLSINFNDFRNSHLFQISSGLPLAVAVSLLWGVTFFLLKIPVNVIGPILTAFILESGITIFSVINMKAGGMDFSVSRNDLGYMAVLAVFGAAGSLFFNYGISYADVSVVASLSMASPLVASIYAKMFYREKLTLIQNVAAVIVVAGMVGVAYFK